MKKQILEIIKSGVSIFLPNYCEVCGKIVYGNTKNICLSCIKSNLPFIDRDKYKRCKVCFRAFDEETFHCVCHEENIFYNRVSSLFYYKENIIELIHLMKFYKRFSLCKEFGFLLSHYRKDYILENDYIIPIPLGRKRFMKRGYNQSKLIAETISKKVSIAMLDLAIERVKDTKALSIIGNIDNRKSEISNAFAVNKKYVDKIKNKNLLIIDDVFTTGSTTNEISRVLKEAGASSVSILTVAHT